MIDFSELVLTILEAKVYPNPSGVILDPTGSPVSSKPKRVRKKSTTATPRKKALGTTTAKPTKKAPGTTTPAPTGTTTPAPTGTTTHHTPPERMFNSIIGNQPCKDAMLRVFGETTTIIKANRGPFKYTNHVILDSEPEQLKALEEMMTKCHDSSVRTNVGKYSEYISVVDALTQAFDASADKRYGADNDKKTHAYGIDKSSDNMMTNGTFVSICTKIADRLEMMSSDPRKSMADYSPSHTTVSRMWNAYIKAIKKQNSHRSMVSGLNRAVGSFQPGMKDITQI